MDLDFNAIAQEALNQYASKVIIPQQEALRKKSKQEELKKVYEQ